VEIYKVRNFRIIYIVYIYIYIIHTYLFLSFLRSTSIYLFSIISTRYRYIFIGTDCKIFDVAIRID